MPFFYENGKYGPEYRPGRIIVAIVFGLVGAILALIVLIGSWYVVDPGESAVVFNRGTGELTESGEGLHFKVPIFETVTYYETRETLYQTEAWGASRDLQDVTAEVAVRYHPDSGSIVQLHRSLGPGYADRLIKPAVQETVKAVTAQYNADELITKRPEVKLAIVTALRERLVTSGVLLDSVDITDFAFGEAFSHAIEQKVTAQQKALEEKNRLAQIEYQAQQQVIQASAEQNATKLRADAAAYKIRAEAEAQADAARIINGAIDGSPEYVRYLWAMRWNGGVPTYWAGGNDLTLMIPVVPG